MHPQNSAKKTIDNKRVKAMKQKFDVIESTCVPLPIENIDTDQIIPARFLKATTKFSV